MARSETNIDRRNDEQPDVIANPRYVVSAVPIAALLFHLAAHSRGDAEGLPRIESASGILAFKKWEGMPTIWRVATVRDSVHTAL